MATSMYDLPIPDDDAPAIVKLRWQVAYDIRQYELADIVPEMRDTVAVFVKDLRLLYDMVDSAIDEFESGGSLLGLV